MMYRYPLKDEEYMESAPKSMRRRLGNGLFYGTSDHGRFVDMVKFMEVWVRSKF